MSRSRRPKLLTFSPTAPPGETAEAGAEGRVIWRERAARLDAVRESIQTGTYEVDTEALVDRLLLYCLAERRYTEAHTGLTPTLYLVEHDEVE